MIDPHMVHSNGADGTRKENVPTLILICAEPRWGSAIERHPTPVRLRWAIDKADLLAEAATWPGSAAIIGISDKFTVGDIVELAQLVNTPYHLALFAVGDRSIRRWQRLLIAVGFDAVFGSTTQVGRLIQLATRHSIAAAGRITQSLEQKIEADLPWKPAGN